MSHKYIDKELFENTDHDLHSIYDDAAFLPFDEPADQTNYEKLGQWILRTQDGAIHQSDFQKLEHCLLTDPHALRYYVEFMWLCAGLHAIFHEKEGVLT
jgi:hypothetical protein